MPADDPPAAPADPIGLTQRAREHPKRERPHAERPYVLATLHEATDEIRELAGTLGLRFLVEVYQNRDRPHAGTFFGKGKLTRLRDWIDELRAEIVPEDWVWDEDAGHWEVREGDLDLRDAERSTADDVDDDVLAAAGGRPGPTAWGGTPWGSQAAQSPDDTDPLASGGTGGTTGQGPDRPTGEAGLGETDPLVSRAEARGAGEGAQKTHPKGTKATSRHSDVGPRDAGDGAGPWIPDLQKQDLLLVLNEDVRPAVLFNLEERLGVEVWDRTRLILEIFGQHAHVKEARLQVELAMLQYEIPLIHEAVHRKRSGERAGLGAGGEYGVADYEDFIKRRMRTVKDELEHIRDERTVRRKVRRERFYLVSLAGYTNAGKSSLLNALTGAGTLSEGTMFSTLETTTRRMAEAQEIRRVAREAQATQHAPRSHSRTGPPQSDASTTRTLPDPGAEHDIRRPRRSIDGHRYEAQNQYTRPILLTDTVGFIQALPAWLLEAFHSTLEEIGLSEVVLLVADLSDPIDLLEEKIRVCREELAFLDVTCPVLLVLNKADLLPEAAAVAKRDRLVRHGLARPDHTIIASSRTLEGVPSLVEKIHDALPNLVHYEARLPPDAPGQRLLSLLYGWGPVFAVDYGEAIQVHGDCDPLWWKDLQKEAQAIGAVVSRTSR